MSGNLFKVGGGHAEALFETPSEVARIIEAASSCDFFDGQRLMLKNMQCAGQFLFHDEFTGRHAGDPVEGFGKMTDMFVEKLFTRENETVEEAKKRLKGEDKEKEEN